MHGYVSGLASNRHPKPFGCLFLLGAPAPKTPETFFETEPGPVASALDLLV